MHTQIVIRVNKRSQNYGILQFINKQSRTEVIIFKYYIIFLIKYSLNKALQMLNTEENSGYKCRIKQEQKAKMEKSKTGRQMGK